MNNLIDLAKHIPTSEATLTVAYTPIGLPMVGRQPLELRLTAATGDNLPIALLSHGFGPSNYIPSKDGYAPLAQFWAERGFAVIQPTHASSRVGGLPSDAPGAPFFWRERVEEIRATLNQLPEVER
jgi:predicted dienelactone hydrolase